MNGMYGYGNGYGYAPPYTSQMGTGAQMPQQYQIIRVNGENGVDALRLTPRSELLAIDISRTDALIGWYVKTDDAGYKSKTPYLLTPYKPQPTQDAVDISNIEERLTKLEEIINEQSTVGKPEGKSRGGKSANAE